MQRALLRCTYHCHVISTVSLQRKSAMNRLLLGYSPDLDIFDNSPATMIRPGRVHCGVAFETENTERAASLLDVAGRPALTALLSRWIRHSAFASGRVVEDTVAAELVKLLLPAARYVLPSLNVPAITQENAVSLRASRFFDIELEGLSPEDQEFEAARRFVQLTAESARQAAVARPPGLSPADAASRAVARAARRYAPGWLTQHRQALASTAGKRCQFHSQRNQAIGDGDDG
jgi:hypothetical protein